MATTIAAAGALGCRRRNGSVDHNPARLPFYLFKEHVPQVRQQKIKIAPDSAAGVHIGRSGDARHPTRSSLEPDSVVATPSNGGKYKIADRQGHYRTAAEPRLFGESGHPPGEDSRCHTRLVEPVDGWAERLSIGLERRAEAGTVLPRRRRSPPNSPQPNGRAGRPPGDSQQLLAPEPATAAHYGLCYRPSHTADTPPDPQAGRRVRSIDTPLGSLLLNLVLHP